MTSNRLLLHACCAPCSTHVLDVLTPQYDIEVFFYNPNIYPRAEHDRRLAELRGFINNYHPGVRLTALSYAPDKFYSAVRGYEGCRERGERCAICYKLRLDAAAKYARENGFAFFTTTLSVSPHKDAKLLNAIGAKTDKGSACYLPSDFKKKDGYLRSVKLSRKYGLYRQEYCGCEYSIKSSSISKTGAESNASYVT